MEFLLVLKSTISPSSSRGHHLVLGWPLTITNIMYCNIGYIELSYCRVSMPFYPWIHLSIHSYHQYTECIFVNMVKNPITVNNSYSICIHINNNVNPELYNNPQALYSWGHQLSIAVSHYHYLDGTPKINKP